jgi:hypothetical protein
MQLKGDRQAGPGQIEVTLGERENGEQFSTIYFHFALDRLDPTLVIGDPFNFWVEIQQPHLRTAYYPARATSCMEPQTTADAYPYLIGQCGPCIAFLTNGTWTGDLGGVDGADAKCQSEADQAGLEGTYKAWISTSNSYPAISFSQSPGPYVLPDRETVIATSWTDLITPKPDETLLRHPIDHDAANTYIPTDPSEQFFVFTNTAVNGYPGAESATCSDWQSDEDTFIRPNAAFHWRTDGAWTLVPDIGNPCNTPSRLYCFQQ